MESFFSGPGFGIGILIGLVLLPFVDAWITGGGREEAKRLKAAETKRCGGVADRPKLRWDVVKFEE